MKSGTKKIIASCMAVITGLSVIAGTNFNSLSADEHIVPETHTESYDYRVLELVGDASQAEFGYLVEGSEPITLSNYKNDLTSISEIVTATNLVSATGYRLTTFININELTEDKKLELGITDETPYYVQQGVYKRGENGTVRYTPTYADNADVAIFDLATRKFMPCVDHVDDDMNCICDICDDPFHIDAEPKDGICEICLERYIPLCDEHTDEDSNCVCDVCYFWFDHVDENKNCLCDVCVVPIPHVDEDINCDCDVCGASVHVDEDVKDCICDKCAFELAHIDILADCYCDVCGLPLYHDDIDGNEYCDICGDEIVPQCDDCVDEDANFICDICRNEIIEEHECVDEDSDTICDDCGLEIVVTPEDAETCKDDDADGKCDDCGKDIVVDSASSSGLDISVNNLGLGTLFLQADFKNFFNLGRNFGVKTGLVQNAEEIRVDRNPVIEDNGVYYIFEYDAVTDTYTPVDEIPEDGIDIRSGSYVFFSKEQIDATRDEETGEVKYILNFKMDETGEWSFFPAFSGRRYEYKNGSFDYANAKMVHSEFYNEYYFADDSKIDDSVNYAYKTELKAVEDMTEGNYIDDINIFSNNCFEQYVVDGKNVEVITKLYGDVTIEDIAAADFVYVNTGHDSEVLRKYWAMEHGCYVEGVDGVPGTIEYGGISSSLSDTSQEVIEALLLRLVNQDIVVMFDDKLDVTTDDLSGLMKLYVAVTMTYPNVANKIGLINTTSYSGMKSLITNIIGGYDLDVTLLGIDNYDLTAEAIAEHNVFMANNCSILTNFMNVAIGNTITTEEVYDSIDSVGYNSLPFVSVMKYDDDGNYVGEESCASMAVCLNYLVNHQKTSALDDMQEMDILEIEPAADFYPEEYWYMRVMGIDPYYDGTVNVTAMQSRTFQGYNSNLYNDYDIVYIGSRYQMLSHVDKLREESEWIYRMNIGVDVISCDRLGFIGVPTTITFDSNVYYAYSDGSYSAFDNGSSVGKIELSQSESNIGIVTSGFYGYFSRIPVYIDGTKFYLNYAFCSGISNYQNDTVWNEYATFDKEYNYYILQPGYVTSTRIGYDVDSIFSDWITDVDMKPYTSYKRDGWQPYSSTHMNNDIRKLLVTAWNVTELNYLPIKLTRYTQFLPFTTPWSPENDLNGDGTPGTYAYDYVMLKDDSSSIELDTIVVDSGSVDEYGNPVMVTKQVYVYDNCTSFSKCALPSNVTLEKVLGVSNVEYVLKRKGEVVGILQATYSCSWRSMLFVLVPVVYEATDDLPAVNTLYNDSRMNGKLYTHVGDLIQTRCTNSNKTNTEVEYSWEGMTHIDGEQYQARLSGNDITVVNYNNLVRFAKSGKILIFASAFFEDDGSIRDSVLDETSYVAKLLRNQDIDVYNESKLKNYDYSLLIDTEFNIEMLSMPIVYRDYTRGDWSAIVDDEPGVRFDNYDLSDGGKSEYTFSELGISDASEKKTAFYVDDRTVSVEFELSQYSNKGCYYTVDLYADLVADGKFDSTEKIQGITVKSNGVQIHPTKLVAGQKYTVTFTVSDEFVGVVHWQLRVKANGSNSYKSFDSYFALRPDSDTKKTLHILQIMPYTGNKFNMSEDPAFHDLLAGVNDFNVIVFTINERSMINWGTNTLNDYIFSLESVKARYNSYNSKVGTNLEYTDSAGLRFHDFDMLVIGYADKQLYSKEEVLLNAIQDFIDSGKAVLCTHDSLLFNYDTWNVDSSNTQNSAHFDSYFRSVLGQDRFGVVAHDGHVADYSKICTVNDNTFFFKHNLHRSTSKLSQFSELMVSKKYDYCSDVEGYDLEGIEGLSDSFILRFANGTDDDYYVYDKLTVYKNDYLKSASLNNGNSNCSAEETTLVSCLNRGQITNYPYYIDNQITVSPTHAQYYQVALDNDEVSVWFCLGDNEAVIDKGSVLKVNPLDARNNYYIYTKGNITYTGVGHKEPIGDELKLFVNTLIMSYRENSKPPRLNVVNENVEEYNNTVDIYLDYDVTTPDVLMDSESTSNKFRIYFNAMQVFSSSNVHNYVQFKDENDVVLPYQVYDLATNSPLPSVDMNGVAYELTDGPLWYFDIPIDSINAMYGDSLDTSYQYGFRFNLLTTYGREDKEISDYYTIHVIKRGLFNMH